MKFDIRCSYIKPTEYSQDVKEPKKSVKAKDKEVVETEVVEEVEESEVHQRNIIFLLKTSIKCKMLRVTYCYN